MEPATGKAKPGRTRAACIGCRSNKQRCDGAQRHPCRRCELYGIACEYEGGAPPKTAVQIDVHDPARAGASAAKVPAFVPPSATSQEQLHEILNRLRKIEIGLEQDRKRAASQSSGTVVSPSPTSPLNALETTPSSSSNYPAHSPTNLIDLPVESNPVQVISETMGRVEESGPGEALAGGRGQRTPPAITPEAILKGLVTLEDAKAGFDFFHERIQPHLNVLGEPEDLDPLLVHSRSKLLFNVVLVVANYYNTSTSPRAQEVYRGLTEIVNLQMAHSLLCPDPNELNADLIRAIVILLFYKPVQLAAYNSRGIADRSRIEHASKVSALSSLMLHGMLHTVTRFMRLDEAPADFLAAIAASSSSSKPLPTRVVSNLRLHYLVLTADMHGSLQSGRPMATNPTPALSTTRQFAQLGVQPQDARRAAGVELYASVRTPPNANQPSKLRLAEMNRINDELDKWETYWTPILANAQKNGKDKLAYTQTSVILNFIKFTVNSATFTRWSLERKWSLEQGGSGRPTLSEQDWASIQSAADAAQKMLFSVSAEAGSSPLRSCDWPAPKLGSGRGGLHLDPSVVADTKTATDTVTSISFIWGVLLLVRLASAGLISCELECRREEYEDGEVDLGVPQPLVQGKKLPRLLELTAKFLRALAPHSSHPAEKQSVLTEMILTAGLKEGTPLPAKSALNQLVTVSGASDNTAAAAQKPEAAPSTALAQAVSGSNHSGLPSSSFASFPAPTSGSTNSITIPATLDHFLWEGSAPGILPESNQPAPFDFLALGGTGDVPGGTGGSANPFAIPFEENPSSLAFWEGNAAGSAMDWLSGSEFGSGGGPYSA